MSAPASLEGGRLRRRLAVRGVVQGVGFRPFVHRVATELGLAGHVGNDGAGVFVEVEGPEPALDAFVQRLHESAPPLARVEIVEATALAVVGEEGFRIAASREDVLPSAPPERPRADRAVVPPDASVCDDCLAELFDPTARRFRYPFVTCTNCGPRFTITERLPYDRPNTTMARFSLCAACQAEYDDPTDRRFHAQPLGCPDCGPTCTFESPEGDLVPGETGIVAARMLLAAGLVLAVKGLGGYHLACDPRSAIALSRLRSRKGRPHKPFAVMARDLATVERLAACDGSEARLLLSASRPIVLLRRHPSSELADLVAPDNPLLGVMLPYTPLHHLLLEAPLDVLVMTSGNHSDEPIAYDDADARRRLGLLADGWLRHDRPIHVPCDDSVVRVVEGREVPLRRSRGYTPLAVALPVEVPPTLAVGGELKTTFCVAQGRRAWLSQHIGDMGSVETGAAFQRSVRQFCDFYEIEPARLAADLHPGYHTHQWAELRSRSGGGELVLVQHHHAHVAAVMAEHGVPPGETVIGVAFDGTGYGTDGTIWGGEVLLARYDGFTRAAHLAPIDLPGGDAAIRRPYRSALAHLQAAGVDWDEDLPPVAAAEPSELETLQRQFELGVRCVPTTSMGRLFDAVASLLDLRHETTFEGQAAMQLEAAAEAELGAARRYELSLAVGAGPLLREIIYDFRMGHDAGAIAAGFHLSVAGAVVAAALSLRDSAGIERVALTGGVFQNALLLRLCRTQLAACGFDVLTHETVPPNDGGLALGQAVVAAAQGQGSSP